MGLSSPKWGGSGEIRAETLREKKKKIMLKRSSNSRRSQGRTKNNKRVILALSTIVRRL